LAAIARGYERAAAAARAHDAPRYANADATLRAGHARLVSAVDALQLLGYQVQENG
jgi:hypothetical protein